MQTEVMARLNASVDETSNWLEETGRGDEVVRHAQRMHARGEQVEDAFIGNRWLTIMIDPTNQTLSVLDAAVLRGAWEQAKAGGIPEDKEL